MHDIINVMTRNPSTIIENVFLCLDDDVLEVTTNDEYTCKTCGKEIESSGWFESAASTASESGGT